MDHDEAQARMQEIQRIMERATLFTLLPGTPAVIGGLMVLAGCGTSYAMFRSLDFADMLHLSINGQIAFCVMWFVIGVAGVLLEVLMTTRAAARHQLLPSDRPMRVAAFSLISKCGLESAAFKPVSSGAVPRSSFLCKASRSAKPKRLAARMLASSTPAGGNILRRSFLPLSSHSGVVHRLAMVGLGSTSATLSRRRAPQAPRRPLTFSCASIHILRQAMTVMTGLPAINRLASGCLRNAVIGCDGARNQT